MMVLAVVNIKIKMVATMLKKMVVVDKRNKKASDIRHFILLTIYLSIYLFTYLFICLSINKKE